MKKTLKYKNGILPSIIPIYKKIIKYLKFNCFQKNKSGNFSSDF